MQTEHNGQIVATEAELNQVKSLMDNSIDNLVDSFVSLKATTRIGQNLISHMISKDLCTVSGRFPVLFLL